MRQVIPTDKLPELVHFLQLKTAGDDTHAARDATACLLGLAGLRRQEVLNLTLHDLRPTTRSIAVETLKNGVPREVPLDDFTWGALEKQAKRAGAKQSMVIMITDSGNDLDGRNLLRTWHRWSKEILGRHYRFHDLRHTAAQTVYNGSGHDIIAVRQLLGHRHVSTTQEYLASINDVRRLLPTNQGLQSDAIRPTTTGRTGPPTQSMA